MPRLVKDLPVDRANYTFGDLVYWHLFVFGTRPKIDPDARAGRLWLADSICGLLGITERTLRNWINDKRLPDDITALCQELFGDNPRWDEARAELEQRLASQRKKRSSGRDATSNTAASDGSPASEIGDAKEGLTAPDVTPTDDMAGDEARAGPAGEGGEDPGEERGASRHTPPNARGTRELALVRPVMLRASSDNREQRRYRRAMACLAAGVAVFLGVYTWTFTGRRLTPSSPTVPRVTVAPPKTREAPVTPPAPIIIPPPPAPAEPARPIAPTIVPPESAQPAPVRPEPDTPVLPPPPPLTEPAPPRVLTEAERQAADERRLARLHKEAVQSAIEAARKKKEQDAIFLEREKDRRKQELTQLENDARIVGKMGYRVMERNYVASTSSDRFLARSFASCALACTSASWCDTFSYWRKEWAFDDPRPRYCYLFQGGIITDNAGWTVGRRIVPRRTETPAKEASSRQSVKRRGSD